MPSKLRFNLISKINLLAVILILLTSSGIAAYAVWRENKHMTAALMTHSESLSNMIADSCEYGIYTRDLKFLERILRSVAAEENLARIAVYDDKLAALIVKQLKTVGSGFDFSDHGTRRRILESLARGQDGVSSVSSDALEFIRPVTTQGVEDLNDFEYGNDRQKRIGYVHVVLSKHKIKENTWEFITSVAVMTVFLAGAGTALMLVLGKRIAAPIVNASQVAREVAEGRLDRRIAAAGENEVGDFARAFNFMLDRLKSYHNKVEGYQKDLEAKVAERTREAMAAVASEKSKTEELVRLNAQMADEIGKRKHAQRLLGKSLETTNRILENMPFGVMIVGRDKKIRMLNQAALKMMGRDSSDGLINAACHQMVCPAEHGKCPMLDLNKKVDSSEKILLGLDQRRIPVLKTVVPITIEDEDVLLEAFVDISALKQVEADLKLATVRAEAANRSKSEFLANMSHELRTPLNHIIGFTELVAGKDCGEINAVQEEYLNDVLRASRHLLSLINDILDLSKVEAGKMDLDAAEVPIRMLLESSLSMVKEKAVKHGIALSLKIVSAPESLTADERKLKQVLYNLLSNAVKFTPDGGKIEVGSAIRNGNGRPDRSPANKNLAIWVKDTGIGIEPHDLERIFAPFEQVEGSISRKFQGTGLGLALTKRMVELHGGNIQARSEGKDKGTIFEFTLPIQ